MKFTIAYTLLFMYVIAAIVFWGYSLHKQAGVVYELETTHLLSRKNSLPESEFKHQWKLIEDKKIRRGKQYLGEGGTFLLITILASSLIYIAYYRQRRLGKLQQNFMLSITHELKTPVAGIKLNLQTMEKHRLDEATQQKLIKSSIQESNRLDDLCNNILLATQLEGKRSAMFPDEINLPDLVKKEVEEFENRYPECMVQKSIMTTDFIFKGEATLWKLVLSNLMENARKYSSETLLLDVEVKQVEGMVLLSIKDQGMGIPDSEKENIFKKFYRIGSEDTRRTKGTGLGLYLVKKIIDVYKYDITVKNNLPKGSIFEIRFT
jgi:K+-sensing histidine kinase KdpD